MKKLITVWERFNTKTEQWEHNHICTGHRAESKPKGKGKIQEKSWPLDEWKRTWGYLKGYKVILTS